MPPIIKLIQAIARLTQAGAIKKIARSNIALQAPSVTSISPTNVNTGDGTGNHTFTITGTKYDASPVVNFVNASGTAIDASSTTSNSATQLTVVVAKSSLPDSGEPYDVKITNWNPQETNNLYRGRPKTYLETTT